MKNELPNKIAQALKRGRFQDEQDLVLVDTPPEAIDDEVHVVVVSRKFEGLRMKEKIALITADLRAKLPKRDLAHITLVKGLTPREVVVGV